MRFVARTRAARLGAFLLFASVALARISSAAPESDAHVRVELPPETPQGVDGAALQKAIDAYLSDFSHDFVAFGEQVSTSASRSVAVVVSWGDGRRVIVVVRDEKDANAEPLSFELTYSEPVEPSFYRSVALKVRSTISLL